MRSADLRSRTVVLNPDDVDRYARLYHAWKRAPIGTRQREEAMEQVHAAAVFLADQLAFSLLGASWYEPSQADRFVPSLPVTPHRGLRLIRSGGSRA